MVKVESSVLYAYEYDKATETLFILFNSNKLYSYSNVPYSTYLDFLAASSKGQFFNHYIRNTFEMRAIPNPAHLFEKVKG